jgi:hypothetical protein
VRACVVSSQLINIPNLQRWMYYYSVKLGLVGSQCRLLNLLTHNFKKQRSYLQYYINHADHHQVNRESTLISGMAPSDLINISSL